MSQFEYVMVLVSIIVGLGVAHLLLGIGGIIGMKTRNMTYHNWAGVLFVVLQYGVGFGVLPTLII